MKDFTVVLVVTHPVLPPKLWYEIFKAETPAEAVRMARRMAPSRPTDALVFEGAIEDVTDQ